MRMTPSKSIGAGCLAVLASLALGSARADAPEHENTGALAQRIEGTWNVRVEFFVCNVGTVLASLDAMALFARGGTFHDTNATNPALRSSAFGDWEHLKGDKYQFAFKFFRFDATGANIGYNVIRHEVSLAPDGQTYTSEGIGEIYDAAGTLLMTGCSRSTATRFW
jgi:hypothetical protein